MASDAPGASKVADAFGAETVTAPTLAIARAAATASLPPVENANAVACSATGAAMI